MSERPAPRDRHLRVGNPQRDHAIEILRGAAADGRLNFDELDARVARALGAATRADLADVLADLVPTSDLDAELGAGVPMGDGPGYSWDEPLLLRADKAAIKVGGDWIVPPFIEIVTGWRGTLLDFTQARSASPVVDIVIGGLWGGVLLIVPDGWGIDLQAVQAGSESPVSSSIPTRPRRGLTRIVVRGRCSGGITVRTPNARDLRRAASGKLQPPTTQLALPPGS